MYGKPLQRECTIQSKEPIKGQWVLKINDGSDTKRILIPILMTLQEFIYLYHQRTSNKLCHVFYTHIPTVRQQE
ncbi:hypothetical protein XENTR_v10019519 [Xenopus tropicalis]|nr:hypothetical protein XENTR_v10019519 [Xenopus tropicalis]